MLNRENLFPTILQLSTPKFHWLQLSNYKRVMSLHKKLVFDLVS